MPSWFRNGSATLFATAASHRLMNTEATEPTSGSIPGTRDLDEEVRPPCPGVQGLGRGERAGSVVGQERGHFQGYPAVHAARPVPDRSEQIGGPGQVLERELEEQLLAGLAFLDLLPDCGVVGRA